MHAASVVKMSHMLLCQGWVSTSIILLVSDTAYHVCSIHVASVVQDDPHAAVPRRSAEDH